MENNPESYELKCAFCGKNHQYSKDELYIIESNQNKIKQKFCQQCGEPLVSYCPNCSTGIFIQLNLDETMFFKIDSAFNDPTPSQFDEILPVLKNKYNIYKNSATQLNPELFKTNQPNYLKITRELISQAEELKENILKIKDYSASLSFTEILKLSEELLKELNRSVERCNEIIINIVEGKEFVNDKMDKKLRKKSLKVIEWDDIYSQLCLKVEKLRNQQIKNELDSYQPGQERVRTFLLHDPSNFRLICPTCKTKIYNIEKNQFVFGKVGQNYDNSYNLSDLLGKNIKKITGEYSDTHLFQITIYISKPGGETLTLNAKMNMVLNEGEEQVIGRNFLRDLLYEEPEADDLLFNEDEDILKMVSRTQLTFFKENTSLKVRGMEYDERRIGTFLNTMDEDIRLKEESGVNFSKNDVLIIPVTAEPENKNRIEIRLIKN